jgi:hypothetical protein
MPQRFRPDRSKVVLATDENGGRLVAHCDPSNHLAWRREPIFSLLKQQARATWGSEMHVVAKAGQRLWVITPVEEIDLGEVHERSPVQILQFRDGSATVTVLPPVPEGADIREHVNALKSPG